MESSEIVSTRTILQRLRRLHRDDTGDEGVNKILIIAMIVIPLVILLIVFRKKLKEWWDKMTGKLEEETKDA